MTHVTRDFIRIQKTTLILFSISRNTHRLLFSLFLSFFPIFPGSRVILSYLVSAYGKDESLYPKDFRSRAVVDQRLHFDLGTLYQRVVDYFVSLSQLCC